MGTPEYVSPEQATDARSADTRADVYSLGCTLYALLAGRPPFVEGTMVKLVLAHIEKQPTPLHKVRADAPRELSAVVAKMLSKDPDRRYQTPLEVARALAPFAKAGQKMTTARPMPASAAAVASPGRPTLLPTDTSKLGVRDPDGLPQRQVAARKKARAPRGRPWVLVAGVSAPLVLAVLVGIVLLATRRTKEATVERPGQDSTQAPASPTAKQFNKAERPVPLDCTGPEGVSAAEVRRAQQAWAKSLGRQVEETIEIGNGVKMTFVLVPPGKFLMGASEGEQERDKDEAPHEVTLTEPFDLGKTEVTQAQYEALIGGIPPSFFKGSDRPVEQVTWEEACAYATELTKKRGDAYVYCLPTEAQWEYGCRSGRPASMPFGIGDGRSLSSRQANINGNFPYGGAEKGPYRESTCDVGSYEANALGLLDMHGNVWEWCADGYELYPSGAVKNPIEPAGGYSRVMRGGSWSSDAGRCRAAYRGGSLPSDRAKNMGFRLARSMASGGKSLPP
jgi:formylglycine-generating enzyme required for sulfatase activity